MSRRVVIGAVTLFLVAGASAWAQSDRSERANRALARWLDEDAAYIITDVERAAFDALQTDEEREQFIENFWLRRDPTPDTIENEYRQEHYARIAYANEHFSSGIPGWKTDRGRIYIIHGPPDDIESKPTGGRYDYRLNEGGGGTTSVYPFERWRYRYIEGMPFGGTEVEFEFVDPTFTGEYRLALSPFEKDALAKVPGMGFTDFERMSSDPEAARLRRGTSSSANLQGSIFDQLELYTKAFQPPEIKFKDLETIVTTNLSFNLLPFEMRADFVPVTQESILTPITVQIRNRDLAFQENQGIQQAVLHIYGRVTAVNGRIAQTFEDTLTVDIPNALFTDSLDTYRVYQKVLPLRPGLYKIDLVLKDLHSTNVGTLNQRLAVPRFPEEQLSSSSLILADLIEPLPSRQVGSGPFVLGGLKVRPSVLEEFRQDGDLNYWLQVYNLKVDEELRKPQVTVETLITRDGRQVEKIVETTDQLSGAAEQLTLQKTLPLANYEPGEYTLEVRVTDNLSGEIISQSGDFVVRKAPDKSASVQ